MTTLRLFEGYGVELEYMIVDSTTLDVRPLADELIKDVVGSYETDVENDEIDWSNELSLHLIELKNNRPRADVTQLTHAFHAEVTRINSLLKNHHCRLMPTAMHPWMNPDTETKLWPHDNKSVYNAYNRVFNCSGHGWSNLQSTHINFSFSGSEEFGRLHAAIRLVLPLIPALAASSPIFESGIHEGALDQRLLFYFKNQRRIPSILGNGIPEQIWTIDDYKNKILNVMYQDIAPLDPTSELQHEWLNSRAAIPKFERSCIEIRAMDIQECPKADLALVDFFSELVKLLVNEDLFDAEEQRSLTDVELKEIFLKTSQSAGSAILDSVKYQNVFKLPDTCLTVHGAISFLFEKYIRSRMEVEHAHSISYILNSGTLSERILKEVDNDFSRTKLIKVYGTLCDCLENNEFF